LDFLPLPVFWPWTNCFCVGPLKITDTWVVTSLGAAIIAFLVMATFAVLFYLYRNAGPRVWNSSWMPLFYGYLIMQFAGCMGFLFIFGWGMNPEITGWRHNLALVMFSLDIWCGYWVVGQYLVVSPLADMFNLKWGGWFKILNYVFTIATGVITFYFEFAIKDPWKNAHYQQWIKASELAVYLGNFICIIELFVMRWLCSYETILMAITTALNVIALYTHMKPQYSHDPAFMCVWYVLEGLALILIWFFFTTSRKKLDDDEDEVYEFLDEYAVQNA